MDRRTFTKTCINCITSAAMLPMLAGCQSTYYTSGTLEKDGISVSAAEFTYLKNEKPIQREYVIVRNEAIEFPIYVYKLSDQEYSAVLMKCTHQGNELQASGDHLTCPAHGSEFNNKGIVAQGPAEKDLRRFNVVTLGDKIFIDLRA